MSGKIIAAAASLAAVNAMPIDSGFGSLPVGVIAAANESRFNANNLSVGLTAYAVGYRDTTNLDTVIDTLFPGIEVARRFEFVVASSKDGFLVEVDDVRAIGGEFKVVPNPTGTVTQAKTKNCGLTVRVDLDEVSGSNWKEAKVRWLMDRVRRNSLRRGLAIVDGAASNTAVTWTSGTPNPDGHLRAALKASADVTGIRPNMVVYGEAAWTARKDAYEIKDGAAAGRLALYTPEDLARVEMLDKVVTVSSRYSSGATSKAEMIGSKVYAYLAMPGMTIDDPSTFKRFYTPTSSGGRWAVYEKTEGKFCEITVECYELYAQTGEGARKLTVS